MGWCGLDSRRLPLTGRELRGCWTPAQAHAELPVIVVDADVGPGMAPSIGPTLFGELEG